MIVMDLIQLLENNNAILILVIIIIVVIILVRISKSKHSKHSKDASKSNFGGQAYQKNILESLPYDDRLDYTNLYNKLNRIHNDYSDIRKKALLDYQITEAIDSIQTKAFDSRIHIENYWKNCKQKEKFYQCIGLHYASFTLANKIKREQENIREEFVRLKKECDRMSMEINKLNKQIDNAKGIYRYTLMQQHKELCNQHQRASKIKGIFGSRNTQFLNMVKEQNNKTREYREYIINNFGIKGKQWGEKLKNRKLDLVQE